MKQLFLSLTFLIFPLSAMSPNIQLHNALARGNSDEIKQLLDSGALPNEQLDEHLAEVSADGDFSNAKLLIEHGANVNVQHSRSHRTPLHDAVLMLEIRTQHRPNSPLITDLIKTITVLLEHGANPRIADAWGKSPLSINRIPEIDALFKKYATNQETKEL